MVLNKDLKKQHLHTEKILTYYKEHGHTPEHRGEEEHGHRHDPSIKTFCVIREEPMSLDMLRMFLEGLSSEAGPDLLRVKGIINIENEPDRPAVIQGAQQILHSLEFLDHWPSEDRRTRIVFITRNIDQEYIENMLNLGHLSVIEHATATFRISGISRACSHELVRHRHFSFSQLSQRYVPHDGVKFIEPDAIASVPEAHEVFTRAIGQAQEAYDQILEIMTRKFEDVENRTMRLKMARQAARMVLPNATETRMVISANFRALRHFFRMRCTEFADPEIRSLAIQMLKIVREEAPAVFGDYKITLTPEGYEVAETIHTYD